GDGDPGDGDGDPCTPGTQGCACVDDMCDDGLSCVEGLCIPPSCGDGVVDPGEECDVGGETMFCDADCTYAVCGDGYHNTLSEDCDDGNNLNDDGCVGACVTAYCGDGYVWAGMEECDDGNLDNEDMCTQLCQAPFCGDGFVQPMAGETCDDGNMMNADGCEDSCVLTPGAVDIAAGNRHTCVVSVDGEVHCWGGNASGQLGYPNMANSIGDNELPNSVAA
ncbi:MAG: DUF4215 domain-containing protein, partial [Myxococcales bacterium]|nr:DUF4215 domain-containing protein [Myxococcales bacterium]